MLTYKNTRFIVAIGAEKRKKNFIQLIDLGFELKKYMF